MLLAELLATGCMRIGPDPDLPDVPIKWDAIGLEDECKQGTATVALDGVDDPTLHVELSAPCTDGAAVFVDVPRARFLLTGTLRGQDKTLISRDPLIVRDPEFPVQPIDLRAGLDDDGQFLSFQPIINVFADWSFESDTTCDSLAVDTVEVRFASATGEAKLDNFGLGCQLSSTEGRVPGGTYEVRVHALAAGSTVAVSAPITGTFDDIEPTELAPFAVVACGDACP